MVANYIAGNYICVGKFAKHLETSTVADLLVTVCLFATSANVGCTIACMAWSGGCRSRWDRGRIVGGLDRLRLAAGATGPYLPQAVIAALHATAPHWEQTGWTTICAAYDRLIAITDSAVARANRALAVGFRDGSAPARELLARRLAECEQS
jgi:predicted RNA polymerase sigma factor